MLDDPTLQAYLDPLSETQQTNIRLIRNLIEELNPSLVESIDEGKWFGGLLVYHTATGFFVYALGPRKDGTTTFHMMAYYGSPELQATHGPALKKILTGKSCVKFKSLLPEQLGALTGVIASAKKAIPAMQAMFEARKK